MDSPQNHNINEFAINQDISSIRNDSRHNGVEAADLNDLLLLDRDETSKAGTNKIRYYNQLKEQNKQMGDKIKEINMVLQSEVKEIEKKMFVSNLKRNPRVKVQRSKEVQSRYKELQSLKKQLAAKITQKKTVEVLEGKLKQLKAEYKQKYQELEQKQHLHRRLCSRITEKQKEESYISNNSTTVTIIQEYHTEANQIREQIKKESKRVYQEKQEFINEGRIRAQKERQKNKSLLELKKSKQWEEDQHLSEKAQELKREYKVIGKRIELLKIQKLALLNSEDDNSSKKKYLQHLQSKLKEINKLL